MNKKTIWDCKVESITGCAAAWERLHAQGTPDSTPADCARHILANASSHQIDSNQMAQAVMLLKRFAEACGSKYMAEVAAGMIDD